MLATAETVDLGRILFDLAAILVVAKLAAELSERVAIPAVIGEIVAGMLIGPHVFGLAHTGDVTSVISEIGVVLLLLKVGMEMDLFELKKVGRVSLGVAALGVVVPMAAGIGAGLALGESGDTSLFLGAAMTATSVGITARVLGDLNALSRTESRIILGAAVADDILGLIILTVVARVVETGDVDLGDVGSTIGIALAFLVAAGAVAIVVLPRIFDRIENIASAETSLPIITIGTAFCFAALAIESNLAPIIGAFVAGLAVTRCKSKHHVEREIDSIASFFIPVFFVGIGMNTDLGLLAHVDVLAPALLLSVIAIGGKAVAGLGARSSGSDGVLVGIGMIPRGEVGLIFATIGLSVGVFDEEMHAVVLLVVLITTLVTPPLLRWRIAR